MDQNNLIAFVSEHPVLFSSIIFGLLLVLHLPYRIEQRYDRKRRASVIVQSIAYRYSYGPSYRRLDYAGLRQVQRGLVDLLAALWKALRGDLLRRALNALRAWLGL